jgi:predicted RNA-binding Zn-ribbon protein involved in translation (DUF1610 family)/sarcosine oxidase delta subunit
MQFVFIMVESGDKNAAADWISAHNASPAESNPSTTFYQPPHPVVVFRDASSPHQHRSLRSTSSRFACGSCGTIMSVDLPSSPVEAGSQISCACPTCGVRNIIPLVDSTSSSAEQPSEPSAAALSSSPHFSSYMFFDTPQSNTTTTYSHQQAISPEDVSAIKDVIPEASTAQIEEALRIHHGDRDDAINWILTHNEHPDASDPEASYYHAPAPVACHICNVQTPVASSQTRFKCGKCRHMVLASLPTGPIQPGSQMSFQCPFCSSRNIIPFRQQAQAQPAPTRSVATLF